MFVVDVNAIPHNKSSLSKCTSESMLTSISNIKEINPLKPINPASSGNGSGSVSTIMLATDNFFKKPFAHGWKRKLVLHPHPLTPSTTGGQETAIDDVIFITPTGCELRSKDEIAPLLEGDLTIAHFCFQPVPQEAGPEYEIVVSHTEPLILPPEQQSEKTSACDSEHVQQVLLKPKDKNVPIQNRSQSICLGTLKATPAVDAPSMNKCISQSNLYNSKQSDKDEENSFKISPPSSVVPSVESFANQNTTKPRNTPGIFLATDEFYKKPFLYGWKRELVLRSTTSASGTARGDVFFISPAGKKLRSKDDIIPLLEGDLTIQHFCFQRVPQGASSEYELVRQAVPLLSRRKSLAPSTKTPVAVSGPTVMSGKRIPKPKLPKGASPPPEGWTPTMAVKGNARVLAASNNNGGGSGSARKRGNLLKGAAASVSSATATATSFKNVTHNKHPIKSHNVTPALRGDNTVRCLRCQVVIEDNRKLLKFAAASEAENTCHICMSCLKSTNNNDDSHHSPQKQSHTSDSSVSAQKSVLKNNKKIGHNKAILRRFHSKSEYHNEGNNATQTTSTTEGSQLAEQVSNFADNNKRTAGDQEIVVIKGRKYISISGGNLPPSPKLKLITHEPDLASYYRYHEKYKLPRHTNFVESMDATITGVKLLMAVMKVLSMAERNKLALVCKTWHMVTRDRSVWNSVSLRNTQITEWSKFFSELARKKTQHLDMQGVSQSSSNEALRHVADLRLLSELRSLRTDICENEFLMAIFKQLKQLRELRSTVLSETLNIQPIKEMRKLEVLRIKFLDTNATILPSFAPLAKLSELTTLSIRGITNMSAMNLSSLAELTALETLVLGTCLGMDTSTFGNEVLPQLQHLKHMRLENRHSCTAAFPTNDIMNGVSKVKTLTRLELINVDIDDIFKQLLKDCRSIRELLLMPNYINNAAKTTNAIMQAISNVSHCLSAFTLGLTVELLRMTAALCPNDKDKQCIPVVRPVPGVLWNDELNIITDCPQNAPREWAFLPVERLESILHIMMPQAKLNIAKVPHSETILLQF